MIVRFVSYQKRNEFLFGKSKLKKSMHFGNAFITEDLTPLRSKLLRYLKKECDDDLHHGKLPEVFYKSFTKIASVYAHDTRFQQSAFYVLSRVSKSFCKNQLSYRGTKLWCKLDSNYKSIHWTSCKKRFKKYLLDRY